MMREEGIEKSFQNLSDYEKWDIPDNGKIDELMLNCQTICRSLIYDCIMDNYNQYSEIWKNIINHSCL